MNGEGVYRFLDCEVDSSLGELRKSGQLVALQAQPFKLLVYLIEHRDNLVSKDELLDELWPGVAVSESALTSALRDVRRAVGQSEGGEPAIKTLRGRGYRFNAPVEELRRDARSAALGPGKFVGRTALIEQVQSARASALGGSGGIVLLAGEPGIGKTRILEEFRRYVAPAASYTAWCDNAPETPPYWPWIQILRALSENTSNPAELPELMALMGGDPGSQLQGRDPGVHPEAASFALSDRLSRALQKFAKNEPLVLCFDDLHFADSASLRLLVFLAHEIAHAEILIVGSYRPSGAQPGKPITQALAELVRLDLCQRTELGALGHEDTHDLVASLINRDPSAELIEIIAQKTEGNPFFIHELVRYFGTGSNPEDWLRAGRLEVPPGLDGILQGRLGGLSSQTIDILTVAAAAGPDIAVSTISRALELEVSEVAEALEAASEAGVIRKTAPDHYRFIHTLVRETLYSDQSPRARASVHQQLGEALETGTGPSPILGLAHHFARAAEAGSAPKAFSYAEQAGKKAIQLMAFDEAAEHFGHALELKEAADATHRCELLLDLAAARDRAGHRPEARASYQEASQLARQLGDARLLARSAEGFAGRPFLPSVDEAAVALLEEALEAQEFADTEDRVRILAWLAGHLFSNRTFERAEALVGEALGRAERIRDPRILAPVLDLYSWILWVKGAPEERNRVAARCFALADEASDDITAAHALLHRSRALREDGKVAESDDIVALVETRVRDKRLVTLEHFLESYRAMRSLLRGDFTEAERASIKAHGLAQKVDYKGRDHAFAARMGLIRFCQGRIGEMASTADQIVSGNPDVPGWRCALSIFFAELGHRDEAVAIIDDLAHERFRDLLLDPEWLISLNLLAESSARIDYDRHAESLYEILLPFENRTCVMGSVQLTYSSTARGLGLLANLMGETSTAISHLERACDRHAAMGAGPLQAQSQLDLARSFFSRGRPEDSVRARALIAESLTTAERTGMPHLAARCREIRNEAPGD